jgi:hypothetical protein
MILFLFAGRNPYRSGSHRPCFGPRALRNDSRDTPAGQGPRRNRGDTQVEGAQGSGPESGARLAAKNYRMTDAIATSKRLQPSGVAERRHWLERPSLDFIACSETREGVIVGIRLAQQKGFTLEVRAGIATGLSLLAVTRGAARIAPCSPVRTLRDGTVFSHRASRFSAALRI